MPADVAKNLAQVLSEAIRQRGYKSLKDAAKATGLSEKTVRGALSGASTPAPATLVKMASRLGLDADQLLRAALRQKALGERILRQGRFFDEWDLLISRARALGPEVERELMERCDWFLRGAEQNAGAGRTKRKKS